METPPRFGEPNMCSHCLAAIWVAFLGGMLFFVSTLSFMLSPCRHDNWKTYTSTHVNCNLKDSNIVMTLCADAQKSTGFGNHEIHYHSWFSGPTTQIICSVVSHWLVVFHKKPKRWIWNRAWFCFSHLHLYAIKAFGRWHRFRSSMKWRQLGNRAKLNTNRNLGA